MRQHAVINASPREMFLLGAGASAEAGVPTTFPMTARLAERLNRRHHLMNPPSAAFNFVCGALLAYDAATGVSPFLGLDVERVFAAIELLGERHELEVTPFVSAWHPAVDGWDTHVTPRIPAFFDKNLLRALQKGPSFDPAGKLIAALIDSRLESEPTGDTYRELAKLLVSEIQELVATTEKSVAYLGPLVIQGQRPGGITIATLNYDVAVEQAAVSTGVSLTTGIEGWLESGTWKWPPEGVRLLKLHGSIDWEWRKSEHRDGHLPRRVVGLRSGGPNDGPALVFGQRGKLRAEGPFLGLLAELEAQLARSNRLVVIGYSFRDEHVNELIRRWASEDESRLIKVVDPNWPIQPEPGDFRGDLEEYLLPPDWKDPPPFEARLEVIKEPCSVALG